jgi:hypothetical protein
MFYLDMKGIWQIVNIAQKSNMILSPPRGHRGGADIE